MQNNRGDKESPWKIPHLIFIPGEVKIPLEWDKKRLVSHIRIEDLRKLIRLGEILKSSKQRRIQECGTLSNAFL
jgi:hypothetical protein